MKLLNKRIAILAADGFEQAELEEPSKALERAGADVVIVSPQEGQIQGMHHMEKGDCVEVDLPLSRAHARDFDALMIPGGLINPDSLRSNEEAVEFVREFAEDGKVIAAICHAPWVLIEAGILEGRTITSWPAIRSDILNAGGIWVNKEVVTDHGLVTSRSPEDLNSFNDEMIKEIAAH